jgi:peroxiredoxin
MNSLQCVLILLFCISSIAAQPATSLLIGKSAPQFRLPNRNAPQNPAFSLESWFSPDSGHAVMVTFFAAWCAPCRIELPFLQQATDSLASKGLRMVAVSVDSAWGATQQKMVLDAKLSCPVIHDTYGIIARRYECPGALPYTVFINRSGTVAAVSTGFDKQQTTHLLQHIQTILQEH